MFRPWACVVLGWALALVGCAHAPPGAPAAAPANRSRVVVVAGGGEGGSDVPATGTVPALKAKLIEPFGVALDGGGNLYIVEHNGNRVLRVDPTGQLGRVAGTGQKGYGGDGGPGTLALLDGPHHIAFPPGGGPLFVADTVNNRVRSIDVATGTISALAGTGEKAMAGDGGPASAAAFNQAFCLAFAPGGSKLYVADTGNRRVRVIDRATGVIDTFAGNGDKGVPRDGAVAREAPLLDPRAVAVDSRGNVYVLERNGNALRVVDGSGKIRTVAGTGVKGMSGDGGDARAALLNGPKHIGVDAEDNVLVTDTENHVIRRYQPRDGRIVRVAGTGARGAAGVGGPPESVELARPHGAFVDPAGAVYISDSENHRILKIERH